MKIPFRSTRTLAIAFMSLAGMFASAAFADQTFTITVPQRGFGAEPAPETASVKIRIEGTGVGASTATANGTAFGPGGVTTCDVDPGNCSQAALFTYTGEAQTHVAALKRVTANRIDLVFDLKEDFTGNNFCGALKAGVPASRVITLALPGVASATRYRMATYTVPERTSPKCDVPYRRVDSNAAAAVVTGSATTTNDGRLPLDVVLVLDKSGSMGGGFSEPGPTRIQRLKTSAALFVDLWQGIGAGVEGHPDDRLALITFDSTAHPIPLDGANFFKSRGSSITSWDVAISQINGLGAGGSTTVGGSLVSSFEKLAGLTQANDSTIVLFTDGEQNTPPSLSGANPVKFACPTPCMVGGVNLDTTRVVDKVTPILGVGLGPTGSSFFALLDTVSHETAGRARLVNDPTLLDATFVSNLIDALKGNTLSLNARVLGTIAAAEPASPSLTASVDGSVKRISFAMSWAGGNGESAELAVVAPGGVNPNPVSIKRGAFYRVLTYDVTGPAMVGDWQATVVKLPIHENPPTLKYHISVVAVEGKLGYQFFESARLGTGVPVTLRAEVSWEGAPLIDLPPNSIKATIERPDENLGNILHDSNAAGDPKTVGGDAQDALSAKIEQLVATDNLAGRTEPKPLPDTVELVHKGNGLYEGTFDKATVGGQYRLRYDLAWTDPRTTTIRRTETLDRAVPVAADAASSISVTQVDTTAGTATILITPKDKIGNFVGPGYGGLFNVTVTGGGTPVLPLTDLTTRGEYTVQITGIPAGADPQVKITYADEPLRDAPLSKIDDANQGPGPGQDCKGWKCIPWWVWLLILLLIIILILWLRRRSTP